MQTIPQTNPESATARRRVPLSPDEPRTLVEMLEHTVRLHNKPDALNYKRGGTWRSIPSEEMLARARHVALGLYLLDIRRTDRVALLSENCPEWTLADAGCLFAGAVDVPIYPTLTPSQVAYILKDSGARVLFIQNRAKFDQVRDALTGCNALEHVIFFDGEGRTEGALEFSELEEKGRALESERPHLCEELARAVLSEDLATIIYTSGTTGEPKGVMLTHSNLVTNLIDSSGHLAFSESDTVLSVLPFSHVLERLAMYMYLHHGMSIYYAESLEKIGDNMREVRPTLMICVPRLFEKIYAKIKEKAAEGGRAKAAILAWAVAVGKEIGRAHV